MSPLSSQLTPRALRSGETVFRLSWAIMLVIAFFILLWEQSGSFWPRRVAAVVTQPSVQASVQVHELQQNVAQWWRFLHRGARQLATLEHQVRQWQVNTAELQRLQAENEALRAAADQPLRTNQQIAQWYGSDQHWFIDRGCEEGVQANALITADGAFVGTVQAAHATYSEVRTWDDPSWRLAAKVGTESAYGVFSFGRSIPEIEEVPNVYKDSVGAVVVTAGQDAVPPNYLLGTVQEVVEEPGFGTVRMVLDPALDLRQLRFVHVETTEGAACSP